MSPFTPSLHALAIAVLTSFAVGQVPELKYVKLETREATRAATLAQYEPVVQWSDWSIIGPFSNEGRNKHDIVYPPEVEIDLDATYPGKGGTTTRWRPATYDDWRPISLKQFDDQSSHVDVIAYLYREVTADAPATLRFHAGSDDGLKMWFNDALVVDAGSLYRGLNVDDHDFTLQVRPGRNTLLVKVTQGAGGWDFQMKPVVDHRVMAMLEYRLDQDFPTSAETRHYRLLSVLEPPGIVLEVGGLGVMPDGRPVVTTRRGEVWIVDGAYDEPPFDARFKRFAFGLHEPLGARWRDGGLLVTQRGEVTKLVDLDGDDRADLFETVTNRWGVSGNYHEFAFGPKFDGDGRMWVTLNLGFCGSLGKSIVPWRGWAMIVEPDGALTPVCGGLRSPNGLGRNAAGDMFFTDNQGDWIGTNKLSHLDFGDWHGHPGGNGWYETAKMQAPRGEEDFKPPAIWFPYKSMGQSASDILVDDTGGKFGPFAGQVFVGDQTNASVMRVHLERVDGVYQGACFPFLQGFDCGINRMVFGPDGSMFVGMTNRGWGSLGRRPWGLQRVVYTGEEPFEILEMNARPRGFELVFTKPVLPGAAGDVRSYIMESFTYHRWEKYGSDEIDRRTVEVTGVQIARDGRAVRLTVAGLRPGYVHALQAPGVQSADGEPLLHPEAYYTLNVIPR